jgi:protoheme IX farnesyltransferase
MASVDISRGFDPAQTSDALSLAVPADYFALLKPRVMSLVVFTALTGMVLAPGGIHPVLSFVALLCIAVGAGASGALNMWYDADIDAQMARTRERPVPAGRVKPGEALAFGLILSLASVIVLGLTANWVAAALLAFTIFFYVVIYTMWLKRRTPQNIVIGGAAGALPPVVGWAAVTGGVSIEPLVLFLIIFLWTPPHFWALALFRSEDYARAGVPMLPNVAGAAATKRQIFLYSVLLAIAGLLPALLGFATVWYGIGAAVLGIGVVLDAGWVLRMRDDDLKMASARRLFGSSILYLFLIFALLLIDRGVEAVGLIG